ncbi:MAG: GH32 C-terminal domain-containing protein, partial [Planctomycetes bacterium]|nr:GH32 C-terminal domain-containing protein [Planctomycetota bacterium]
MNSTPSRSISALRLLTGGLLGIACLAPAALRSTLAASEEPSPPRTIADKTLVAWVAPADLEQRGGSVLTLENPGGEFDAIVLGEIQSRKWMAGSDFHRRTERSQDASPPETAGPDTMVQIAIAYRDKEVAIYRDGAEYARYTMSLSPAVFSTESIVVMGLRHLDAGGPRFFSGQIEEARIYDSALDASQIAALRPVEASDPPPLACWTFEDGRAADLRGAFPEGRLAGGAKIAGGRLHLDGSGFLVIGAAPPRDRASEEWPSYHISARPEEGLCRPYDANGCIFWKGTYHLMYIFQDPKLPHGGHCWGHLASADLVHWEYLPPSLVPEPGDSDVGIFSGNAFVNKEGAPMLCWFGIGAGVCVATAQDDDLIRWKKHPRNPIIPIPKPGDPHHGRYTVWDPYLWLERDTYYCLLGGNQHPDGEDTLYLLKSSDLVDWQPLHPFYRAEPSWTVAGEDCSCPDFFALGDRHVLMCISHKVGARCYVGRFENERFLPERHVRMNWPGAQFFAPESLVDAKGRRIFWAWVTDPRVISTQRSTGSGVMSLPRVLALADDGSLRIAPAEEIEALRRNHRRLEGIELAADSEAPLEGIRGPALEISLEIDPASAREVGVKVRCSPDGREETSVWHDREAKLLKLDMSRATLRRDVVYCEGPLDTGGLHRAPQGGHPRPVVEAPLALEGGEPLRLRIFLDGPMLEVFANGRQCITQQVFTEHAEAHGVKVCARGGAARLIRADAWDIAPARFTVKGAADAEGEVIFEDRFEKGLGEGWRWLREH